MRGGRHIVVYEDALGGDNAVETWNRLEDGEVSGRVMLNLTYGTDNYASVEVKLSDGSVHQNDIAGRSDKADDKTTPKESQSFTSEKSTKTTPSSKVTRATTFSKHSATTSASAREHTTTKVATSSKHTTTTKASTR